MKRILSLLVITGFGLSTYGAGLHGYDVNNCEFWTPDTNGSGFHCASWPRTVRVAEATSFAKEIGILERKIANLEKRLHELEKPKASSVEE